MSISGAMANALTGLSAASRMGETVSANVANAMTEGYARREVSLTPQSVGGAGAGVTVLGVNRVVNQFVLRDRRLSDAAVGNSDARMAFLSDLAALAGQPGDDGSLTARVATLEGTLIEAQSRPDDTARLQSVVGAAGDVAAGLKQMTDAIQGARRDADGSISRQVGTLNDNLGRIDTLNTAILAARASGRDANALMDQRQSLIDQVSAIVPVREIARDHDQVSLVTTGGAILLEGNPVKIGFSGVGLVTPDMTQAGGALSGLTINGVAIDSSDSGLMGGGTLGAAFAIRDNLAPDLQSQVDVMARDLIERFQSPSVDPTLTPGAAGLLTDAGQPFDPLNEVGLGGRIAVNALVDPAAGGQVWRLRDGLGATSPGPVGDSTLLKALGDALAMARPLASGGAGLAAVTASGNAASFITRLATDGQRAGATQSFAVGRQAALKELELQNGVDTDSEMQTLLQVEQAYSANARVIQTMDDLIKQLIGL